MIGKYCHSNGSEFTSLSFEHVYRKSRADKIANRGESQGDRFPVLFSKKKSFSFETVFISVYRRSKADDRQKNVSESIKFVLKQNVISVDEVSAIEVLHFFHNKPDCPVCQE